MPNLETKPITLLFDLETTPLTAQKTDIHCIVTLDYETGETTRYNDTGSAQPISRGVTYLMDADTIIGHNIIGFDIPMIKKVYPCLLYTSPSPRDATTSRMPSSA